MTDKSAASYKAIFHYIESKIFRLQPSQFMADFESGLRPAIWDFYPNSKLHGCWYHYCSSLRRRLLNMSMYDLITNNSEAKSIYRKMLSLPLLPPESIIGGFDLIKEKARKNKLYRPFKNFFDYFQKFWLNFVRMVLIFTMYGIVNKKCCYFLQKCRKIEQHFNEHKAKN